MPAVTHRPGVLRNVRWSQSESWRSAVPGSRPPWARLVRRRTRLACSWRLTLVATVRARCRTCWVAATACSALTSSSSSSLHLCTAYVRSTPPDRYQSLSLFIYKSLFIKLVVAKKRKRKKYIHINTVKSNKPKQNTASKYATLL